MLGLIFAGILMHLGYTNAKLKWSNFVILAVVLTAGLLWKTKDIIDTRARLGEDASQVWEPQIFALNWLFSFVLYSAIYVAAHYFGRWRRSRKAASATQDTGVTH